jgi:dihydrofolate reductase
LGPQVTEGAERQDFPLRHSENGNGDATSQSRTKSAVGRLARSKECGIDKKQREATTKFCFRSATQLHTVLEESHHATGTTNRERDMTTSRSLISAMQVTLDSYSSEGDAEWVDSWADGLELLPPVDAFVLGGGMFPDYERFWATILGDPRAASAMLGRDVYPREIAYARRAAATPHLVLSKTLTEASWPTARIVHDVNEIRTLKQQAGNAVYIVGGPGLLASLINEGLLDELRLIVHPVITGGGTPVFGGVDERQALELVSAEATPSGRVNVAYRLSADGAKS